MAPGAMTGDEHRLLLALLERLDGAEQEELRNLVVFVGGFDAGAARAVASGLPVAMLARLVDKSLVSIAESPSGPPGTDCSRPSGSTSTNCSPRRASSMRPASATFAISRP